LIAVLVILLAAGPTLAAVAEALVPLVIVAGCVAVVLRLVWYVTRRY
jgi:hypothetical protein